MAEGYFSWFQYVKSLKGQERTDFLAASLYVMGHVYCSAGIWNGEAERIIDKIGIDTLITYRWPHNHRLAHILATVKNTRWLSLMLAKDGGKQLLFAKDVAGVNSLHIAANAGRKKILQAMLACDDDADSLRLSSTSGMITSLHFACKNNFVSVAALLLERRSREQRLSATSAGLLPLHLALASRVNIDVLPVLLAQCAVEQTCAQTSAGKNALMMAARTESASAVRMLLSLTDSLAAQLQARDNEGRSAIDYARDSGNAEVVALIEDAMKTLSAASSSGTTSTTRTTSATSTAAADDADCSDTEVEPNQQ